MAKRPVTVLLGACAVCAALLRLVLGPGSWPPVALGSVGPLAAALATWTAVRRTSRTSPAAVPGLLIKLFGAKLIGFAGYVALVLLLLQEPVAFVVSFTCQYVLLHAVQAMYLRGLAAEG